MEPVICVNKKSTTSGEAKDLHQIVLDLLEKVTVLSYTDHNSAYELLKEVRDIYPDHKYLFDAVLMHIYWARNCSRATEKSIRETFYSNLTKFLPDFSKVHIPCSRKHIPDGFVKRETHLYAVEVKLQAFGVKALNQLKRYMKEYSCFGGVAVAPALSIALPSNVIFVKMEGYPPHDRS